LKKHPWEVDTDGVVIKTAMTPEQLAKKIGGSVEWSSNEAMGRHVVFMKQAEFDADYKRRFDDLCERLDAVGEHIKAGRILKEAEHDVAWCMQWALDQMALMQVEQRKLVEWMMEANRQADKIQRRASSSKGGSRSAEHWSKVAAEAARIARSKGLDSGEMGAEQIARQIEPEVREFARRNGRDFLDGSAIRKIAEYLRGAGIKKRR
jgi:hypothetical protein